MKNNEFITSDTHFFHGNIIDYSSRPFPERPEHIAVLEQRFKGRQKESISTEEFDDFSVWKKWLRDNVHLMNEEMIKRWNAKVPQNAVVYHLGDFGFASEDKLIKLCNRLNGRKRLILGNHDKMIRGKVLDCFEWVKHYYESTTEDGIKVVMCHYAFRVWNRSHRNSWNLYGHSHGSLPGIGKQMDVGVDTHPNYEPYSFYEVRDILSKRKVSIVDHHAEQ